MGLNLSFYIDHSVFTLNSTTGSLPNPSHYAYAIFRHTVQLYSDSFTIKEHQNIEPAWDMKLLIGLLQKRAPIMKTCALKFQHIHACLSVRFRPFI